MFSQNVRIMALVLAGIAMGTIQTVYAQRDKDLGVDGGMLTYSRNQPVIPAYEGYHPNADGTCDMWFGYLNQNYHEEPDIPVGANNNVGPKPYGPDAGQPAHFLPRHNRYVFKVTVPKDYDKEVVWTLTSHGKTYSAYGTLKSAYVQDDDGMQREFFNPLPTPGNKAPVIKIEGDNHRTAKVGEAVTIAAIVTDDGLPRAGRFGPPGPGGGPPPGAGGRGAGGRGGGGFPGFPSICGADTSPQNCGAPNEGALNLASVQGLRMGCFVYRGTGSAVAFDPPQIKMWEDHRGGSPWAAGFVLPPIPKDNRWVLQTSFAEPGNYVVRCLAHDGSLQTPADVAFTVTK